MTTVNVEFVLEKHHTDWQRSNHPELVACTEAALYELAMHYERAIRVIEERNNINLSAMVDAAMVEVAHIHPHIRRSECALIIAAALSSVPANERVK